MPSTAALSQRQRAAIPIDRWHGRRGTAAGGYTYATPMTLAPGTQDDSARYPGTTQDSAVTRDKTPYYHAEVRSPVGDGWVDWTGAGPPRAELHMRTVTDRKS